MGNTVEMAGGDIYSHNDLSIVWINIVARERES